MTEINQDKRYKYIFDEILTLTDDGFVVVDNHDVITDINEQYCQYLKTTREYAIGRSIAEIIPNTKMIDIVNYAYREEGAILRLSEKSDDDSDRIFLVNRSAVYDENHNVIAGVAQVKFRLQTLDSAKKLMREYSEYEFYREEYRSRNSSQYSFDKIVGNSPRFAEVKKAGYKAAKTMFPVLLTGETGTGKEVFANAIHNNGERREKPMVSINCAAIPNELLESELFGYEEGAFTGAKKGGKKGKFELASGGTLFLDEIGDMPLGMQAKLLRVLQEKKFRRIGGLQEIDTDIRLISACNVNLQQYIEEKKFRMDLFYRIAVFPLTIPPLRERREDILPLMKHYLHIAEIQNKQNYTFTDEVKERMYCYDWPGNVRELRNTVEYCALMALSTEITLDCLPPSLLQGQQVMQEENIIPLDQRIREFEKNEIMHTLDIYGRTTDGKKKAAKALGISLSSLYNKIGKSET